ncbi:hypothetical protein K440DRAFT_628041 [Wilcoxina mikolae CBS 423.85]|nr:hypothetical protein K440DRAFT_628041 [Wilcoxina mikolae CBS 423.85]
MATTSDRTYYRKQILANCAIIFPEPEKVTLLTVNESDKCRIFLVSTRTGQLLLEYEGVDNNAFESLLGTTQIMLALHVANMRRGPSPEKIRLLEEDEIAALRRENAELREENAELKGHRISVLERRVDELEKRFRTSPGERTSIAAYSFVPSSSDGSK